MKARIAVVEGEPIEVDLRSAQAIRERLEMLRDELRPRIPFLAGSEVSPVVQNLVGSVQVNPRLILDIEPKTRPGGEWAAAVLDLLTDERVNIEAESRKAQRTARVVLSDALAIRYAETLDRAVRREGPLQVLELRTTCRPALAGRLDVTTWVQRRVLDPANFPQSETLMTVDNSFTSALAWVAETLASRATDPQVSHRLRSLTTRLRPGLPPHAFVDPGVALRPLPAQWRGYQPAWVIARAIIRRIAPLHRSGALDGFGLAIEPWPLLERLLARTLQSAARQAQGEGDTLAARGHSRHPLLDAVPTGDTPGLGRLLRPRYVEPDGSLWQGERVLATFEAKYSRAASTDTLRSHYFQALSTAAALGAPLAVLVYPEASDPVMWDVSGFEGKPARLAAMGLDMYGYRHGGESARGEDVRALIRSVSELADA